MHIAVDIGNTTIAFAVIGNNKILCVNRIESNLKKESLRLQLSGVLRGYKRRYGKFDAVVVCSVFPKVLGAVRQSVKVEISAPVWVVGEDIKVPMPNRYLNPRQVGQDRLVGAYAAMQLYGKPAIVIDLGTAITFDAVSINGEYLGGAIVPGIRLSAESLFLKTALLPEIDIKAPKSVIGRTTQESILSGLFYGYGSLCRGFIELLGAQIGGHPRVIMTGGHTQLMKKFIKGILPSTQKGGRMEFEDCSRRIFGERLKGNPGAQKAVIDENLVFKGLTLLLEAAKQIRK